MSVLTSCAQLIFFSGSVFWVTASFGQVPVTPTQAPNAANGEILQYGKMHEVIGMQQDQARVSINNLIRKPHLYAVGALEKLHGEFTIDDSQPTATLVSPDIRPLPVQEDKRDLQATLLIGAYVEQWTEQVIEKPLSDEEFDRYLQKAAETAGLDSQKPFMFMVLGDFSDVSYHVINGACPVHARIKKKEIPREKKPFEASVTDISGKIIGVFAKDAAGKLTHPATKTHKHLIYKDGSSEQALTGHIESTGIRKGARLFLPKVSAK